MEQGNSELKILFGIVCFVFAAAVLLPVVILFSRSFMEAGGGLGLANYAAILHDAKFMTALRHSFTVSGLDALITVILAFFLAYGFYFTKLPGKFKKTAQLFIMLPMFLPTLTYGFAVIYSLGKQGLITRLLGHTLFPIYGFWGLLIAYIVYTLPPAFILIYTAFAYVDKHFIVVSELMGDHWFRSFYTTAVRPMIGTITCAFILSFFLSFTDFGIPASIGGKYDVVATQLYLVMMGSVPDFRSGSAIAMIMLIPSIAALAMMRFAERFNFHYSKISTFEPLENKTRDGIFACLYIGVMLLIVSLFAIMFIVPFIKSWPYQIEFTLDTLRHVLGDQSVRTVYMNSVMVAVATAVCAAVLAYMGALVNTRSHLPAICKILMDACAAVTNTIPGMVLGIAYLFTFRGTPIQNTFFIIIMLNSVRGFTTPYMMIQSSLSKINPSWETTGALMGDSWRKTICRIVIPNTLPTIFQMLGYIFVQAMVTISAIIFVTGAHTMVMTTKITQAQYFEKYDEVFVLSLLIFLTNCVGKNLLDWLSKKETLFRLKMKWHALRGRRGVDIGSVVGSGQGSAMPTEYKS
ncbi:MAG: ABC transporter permease subunit [Acidaminococcus sp.]|jgi:iron(III) transport system permease protein|nr:ABC transporter permease subunit [Acidaminococcus sp.]MCI2100209.1 ABC transporter permease subunit [Acidaminococcus sp.]MCI2114528.1 ABC transporter permease subunit [Acidaminococcus sp.]MCI2116468.1 ABC transporter permease subunit [Acidaminococcus sp.]